MICNRKSTFVLYPGMLMVLVLLTLMRGVIAITRTKAYFNQTSALELNGTLDIRKETNFAFRTCAYGEMLSQHGGNDDFLKFILRNGSVELHWNVSGETSLLILGENLNNNIWYTVSLKTTFNNIVTLSISQAQSELFSVIAANLDVRTRLLNLSLQGGTHISVGRTFIGCLHSGASVVFDENVVTEEHVLWNICPLNDRQGCTAADADVNDCTFQPCLNGGTCRDGFLTFHCDCTPIYNGSTCNNYLGDAGCSIAPCLNNGTCIDLPDRSPPFRCTCVEGFTGTFCETNIMECDRNREPCKNNGRCIDGIRSFSCNCAGTGYTGVICNDDVVECDEIPGLCGSGQCINLPGTYSCSCPTGFKGDYCNETIDECAPHPCQNDGVCTDLHADYNCTCNSGYSGKNCEENIDDCLPEYCLAYPNTRCEDMVNNYRCVCKAGYTGTRENCEDVDECQGVVCQNNATCINGENKFTCECVRGYDGKFCDQNIDDCLGHDCVNGTCVDGINEYTCNCLPGFTDSRCGTDINECTPDQCENGAPCRDLVNDYFCDCVAGWEGKNCHADHNDCVPSQCLNGATCIDELNGYHCSCVLGYEGRLCENNPNNCRPGICQNNGTCNDLVNDFSCNCTENWMGKMCGLPNDPCAFPQPCQNGGACTGESGSPRYNCSCPVGFTGKNCEENIDDCSGVVCSSGQVCHDKINAYECACPQGFKGDNCSENVNECTESPGICNHGICFDNFGGYTCNCTQVLIDLTEYNGPRFLSGYRGDNCDIDIDECEAVRGQPPICENGMACHNRNGSFSCTCDQADGLHYSGDRCQYKSTNCDRASNPEDLPRCKNNGTCIPRGAQRVFECNCTGTGYRGARCDIEINECIEHPGGPNPCGSKGQCVDLIRRFECTCDAGYTGDRCETDINECEPGPCFHGQCDDLINAYFCDCTDSGFTGIHCENNIDDCTPNPCLHGSNCSDRIKDYHCACFPGYRDKNCETDINECLVNPCQNGAACYERSKNNNYQAHGGVIPGNFTYQVAQGVFCPCQPGFRGNLCEVDIDECLLESEPCFNGGSCDDQINHFICTCMPGFTGHRCEVNINECLLYHPCRHGAPCQDGINDYTCACIANIYKDRAYGGKNCSTLLTGCDGHVAPVCANAGSCVPLLIAEDHHRYKCQCAPGFTGSSCSITTAISFDGSSFISNSSNGPLIVSFRFRTTVPNALLLIIGSDLAFLTVEIYQSRLCLLLVGVDRNRTGCIDMAVNTAAWKDIEMRQTDANIMLILYDHSQMCTSDTCNLILAVFPGFNLYDNIMFGGTGILETLISRTQSKQTYIGCLDDIRINERLLLLPDVTHNTNARIGCQYHDPCSVDPCNGRGECLDFWLRSTCRCQRPYLGVTCIEEYQRVTFTSPSSLLRYAIPDAEKTELRQNVDISLYLALTIPAGMILYLGSDPTNTPPDSYIILQLNAGRICMLIKLQTQTHDLCTPDGIIYNDGKKHSIRFQRSREHLSLEVDSVLFTATFADINALALTPNFLYIGNVPFSARRRKREVPETSGFVGVIQDVRVNDRGLPFFAVNVSDSGGTPVPLMYDLPSDTERVVRGAASDICSTLSPCQNNGNCTDVVYNDYRCDCPAGFAGKNCSSIDHCLRNTCPGDRSIVTCNNLDTGFECVSDATFDGQTNWITLRNTQPTADIYNALTFRFRTRQSDATLIYISQVMPIPLFLEIKLEAGNVTIEYKLNATGSADSFIYNVQVNDGEWHSFILLQDTSGFILKIDSIGQAYSSRSMLTSLDTLIRNEGSVVVGGSALGNMLFHGCLAEIRMGNTLLPFFTDSAMMTNTAVEKFSILTGVVTPLPLPLIGCHGDDVCGLSTPCQNNGTCNDKWNKISCQCLVGFSGNRCENNVDDCLTASCEHGGTCNDGVNTYSCACPKGYMGWRCQGLTNECESLPCLNNGTCINESAGEYSCNCTEEYSGKNCSIQITRTCADDPSPCKNGATCSPVVIQESDGTTLTTYNCSCVAGYTGHDCDTEIDYCVGVECQHSGTCKSNITRLSYTCDCVPGYRGQNCDEEINECDEMRPCQNGATCDDLINDYNCTCATGWRGKNCDENIDECNETRPCERGECTDLRGSYFCNCTGLGYHGVNCENQTNECSLNTPPCKNGASCTDTVGNYSCNCTLGYDGFDCNIPNCSYNQCRNSAPCYTEGIQWKCNCSEYYEGMQCEYRGTCADEPCVNAVTCHQFEPDVTYTNYSCECNQGWTGKNCSEDIDECGLTVQPCHNGGDCSNFDGGYNCSCVLGFTGHDCETNIMDCVSDDLCKPGTCVDGVNSYSCNCTATGFEGDKCMQDVDECKISNICENGGKCTNTNGSFICACIDGYVGNTCYASDPCKDMCGDFMCHAVVNDTVKSARYECLNMKKSTGEDEQPSWLLAAILVPVIIVVIAIIIASVIFFMMARKKRATRGTYSPSRQEVTGARVELDNVMKPPPKERLI